MPSNCFHISARKKDVHPYVPVWFNVVKKRTCVRNGSEGVKGLDMKKAVQAKGGWSLRCDDFVQAFG